jgi:UDP-N-acetylglucosamine 2-epimerase (non-hydrolysing)
MKKIIMLVFGTRPEAIKLAPIIIGLRDHPEIKTIVCVTGQHRSMLDQVLDNFNITPDIDLELMKENQSLSELTGKVINKLTTVFQEYRPDLIIVQGDTTTVFGAALAAFYVKIPVAHVEAGLRTGDLSSPWPEEGNRLLTTRLSSLHFAPTKWAARNLLKESVSKENIYITGNTVIDALFYTLNKEKHTRRVLEPKLKEIFDLPSENKIVLITGHRRENFGLGFENICNAIKELSLNFPDVHFVYPVHLNPMVQEVVERLLGNKINSNVHLLEPLKYNDFILLMNRSYIILTDSGGIQEEAPSLGKPVLVMRDKTERPEAISGGISKLVGTKINKIVSETSTLINDKIAYDKISNKTNPFGNGKSAEKIIQICRTFLLK